MPVTSVKVSSFKTNIKETELRLEELRKLAVSEGRKLRVIDVGGGQFKEDKWSGLVTAIVDLSTPPVEDGVEYFCVDLEDELSWQASESDIMKNGKYDFCICRHTLEDLNNPRVTARWLQKVAKEGSISVPVYTTELGRDHEGHRVGPGYRKSRTDTDIDDDPRVHAQYR